MLNTSTKSFSISIDFPPTSNADTTSSAWQLTNIEPIWDANDALQNITDGIWQLPPHPLLIHDFISGDLLSVHVLSVGVGLYAFWTRLELDYAAKTKTLTATFTSYGHTAQLVATVAEELYSRAINLWGADSDHESPSLTQLKDLDPSLLSIAVALRSAPNPITIFDPSLKTRSLPKLVDLLDQLGFSTLRPSEQETTERLIPEWVSSLEELYLAVISCTTTTSTQNPSPPRS